MCLCPCPTVHVCVSVWGGGVISTHLLTYFSLYKNNLWINRHGVECFVLVFPLAKVGLGDVPQKIITIFSVNIDNCHDKCHLFFIQG